MNALLKVLDGYVLAGFVLTMKGDVLFNRFHQLAHRKRLAHDFVHADAIDQVLRTQQHPQLSGIQFGNQHCAEVSQQRSQVRRQRVHVTNMRVADFVARFLAAADSREA